MKITNRTKWKTAHLRAIIGRAAKEELSAEQFKRLRVEVTHNRQGSGWCSGWAYLNSSTMRVMVPTQWIDLEDLALTAVHEAAHTRGLRHKDMRGSPHYRRVGTWRDIYSWAKDMPMEKQEKPKRLTGEALAAKKLDALLAREKAWTAKAKRAQTALRNIKQKKRYYERRLAAFRAGD